MHIETLSEEDKKIFNEMYNKECKRVHTMMVELYRNWTHLGLDSETKISNIKKFTTTEKDLLKEILLETHESLRQLTDNIKRLQKETKLLARALSIQSNVVTYDGEMKLCEYKKKLEEQISEYKEQVKQRHMRIERLFEWQSTLKEKLGVSMDDIREDPLPSEEELNELNEKLAILQNEYDRRLEIFHNTQAEVKDIIEKLQIKPQNDFEQTVVTSLSVNFQVTDLNMERLHKLRQDFQEKYEHTNNRVLELRGCLTKLWDYIEEDHVYRRSFLQSNSGCNSRTEAALRQEIKRCETIKKQKLQLFIANVRTKIKLMWDNCLYSDKQREEFVHYFHDIFTEDSLTLHELYLNKITKFYEEHKMLFQLTRARKTLWMKMVSLDARELDRGGRLLQEVKEWKAKSTAIIVKIEKLLRNLVAEYEAKTGQVFTVEGKQLLQVIEEEWEQKKSDDSSEYNPHQTLELSQDLTVEEILKMSNSMARHSPLNVTPASSDRSHKPCRVYMDWPQMYEIAGLDDSVVKSQFIPIQCGVGEVEQEVQQTHEVPQPELYSPQPEIEVRRKLKRAIRVTKEDTKYQDKNQSSTRGSSSGSSAHRMLMDSEEEMQQLDVTTAPAAKRPRLFQSNANNKNQVSCIKSCLKGQETSAIVTYRRAQGTQAIQPVVPEFGEAQSDEPREEACHEKAERRMSQLLIDNGLSAPNEIPGAGPSRADLSGETDEETQLRSLDRTPPGVESDVTTTSQKMIRNEWSIHDTMIKVLKLEHRLKHPFTLNELLSFGGGSSRIAAAKCFSSLLKLQQHQFVEMEKHLNSTCIKHIQCGPKSRLIFSEY